MNRYKIKKTGSSLSVLLNSFSTVAWLIVITIFISLIGRIIFAFFPDYIDYLALKPSNIMQGKFLWTLITHMFIHSGIGHLLINMFVLFSLGSLCERIIGRKRFLWFYILSGIFAGILSVALSAQFGGTLWGERIFGSPDLFMVGASGAIFANWPIGNVAHFGGFLAGIVYGLFLRMKYQRKVAKLQKMFR